MPIRKYMSGATFGPETISNMTTAFERIRKILKLEDSGDPLVEVVAKKVISLASQGMLPPKTWSGCRRGRAFLYQRERPLTSSARS
jgi:hypothetical protein